jgi:hypothetical protein
MSLALLGEIAKTRQSAIGLLKEAALKATRKNSKLYHEDTGEGSSFASFFIPHHPCFLDRAP